MNLTNTTKRNHKKAMEQSIWIIITIVVALITALAIIILVSTTSTNTQNNILPIIGQIGENLKNLITGATN